MAGEAKREDWVAVTRRSDYGRFLAIQTAPAMLRPALYALTAFHLELERIVDTVSEPLIGHIKLAWWREALTEILQGKPPRAHPLLQELAARCITHPALMPYLMAMAEAHEAALDPEDCADESAWLARIDAADGSLHHAWAIMLGADTQHSPQIAQDARGYGAVNRIRAIPFLKPAQLMQLPATLRIAHAVDAFAPGESLNRLVGALLAVSCNHPLPEDATARLPKPLRALRALARLQQRHLARTGHDPYHVGPGKLACVWCVLRA